MRIPRVRIRTWLLKHGFVILRMTGALDLCGDIVDSVRERGMLLSGCEASAIMHAVKATERLDGAIAELGVYSGGSAKLICLAKGGKPLHLFDTFHGLPEVTAEDAGIWEAGEYAATLESVRQYLSSYPNVHFHPGLFPDTASGLAGERFSFVHLDADLYASTKAALEFFYPRMVPQGVILSHDSQAPGVWQAFSEFFALRPEIVLRQSGGRQCFIVKQQPSGSSPQANDLAPLACGSGL